MLGYKLAATSASAVPSANDVMPFAPIFNNAREHSEIALMVIYFPFFNVRELKTMAGGKKG
jgi:hypothetical protein